MSPHVFCADAALLVILAWCGVLSILAWMFQWGLSRQHLPEEDFLDNIFSPAELEEGLLRLRAAPPKIKMSMAAFHEETEWVERSDGEETTINCETTRFYAWKSSRLHKYRCSKCSKCLQVLQVPSVAGLHGAGQLGKACGE